MSERSGGHWPLRWVFSSVAAFFVLAGLLLHMTAPEAEQLDAVGASNVLRKIRVAMLKPSSVDASVEIAGVLVPRRIVLLLAETSGPSRFCPD